MTGNASEKPLSRKVALVTGGGRGIGRECALACAEAGASVAVAATVIILTGLYLARAEAPTDPPPQSDR